MKKEFLECGKVLSAHGVRGLVKVEPWCDSPKVLASQKRVYIKHGEGEYLPLAVNSGAVMGQICLMELEGIDTRETAQCKRGLVLYLRREQIPLRDGGYFIQDIIDLPVIDVDTGKVYGKIKEVTDGVQGKLFTVGTDKGDVLFPGIGEFVINVDIEKGVYVRPIPGFFD